MKLEAYDLKNASDEVPPDADIIDKAVYDLYGIWGYRLLNMVTEAHPEAPLETRIQKVGEHFVNTQTALFRETNIMSIAESVVPLLRMEKPEGTLSILEVGCSSGEESYSLSASMLGEGHDDFHIIATDVNPRQLELAEKGEYKGDEVFERMLESSHRIPNRLIQAGYFIDTGKTWSVVKDGRPLAILSPSGTVKEKISFVQHDIVSSPIGSDFDLALVNNVLMHYPDKTRDVIMRNVISSLRPGGYLTIEAKIPLGDSEENAWLTPYYAWRDTMAVRHNLMRLTPPSIIYRGDAIYRTETADNSLFVSGINNGYML
jgi:chemotaxis methyl-accepting protein methylase